jgi:dihydroxyacid dehydratase/phosphogluconate dehydratase
LNLIDGNIMTVTGKTLGENLDRWDEKHGKKWEGQQVIRSLDNPIKETGHIRSVLTLHSPSYPACVFSRGSCRAFSILHSLMCSPSFPRIISFSSSFISSLVLSSSSRILRGNLAPGGSVSKITGKEGLHFRGKARVFDVEEDFVKAVEDNTFKKGEKAVVVLRYLGPKGGPGMPEMLKPTSLIMGAGLGYDVACLTDGRFSGG